MVLHIARREYLSMKLVCSGFVCFFVVSWGFFLGGGVVLGGGGLFGWLVFCLFVCLFVCFCVVVFLGGGILLCFALV